MAAWLKELEEVRRKYATGKPGLSTEQILDADRGEPQYEAAGCRKAMSG
jgi:hypothetical protein